MFEQYAFGGKYAAQVWPPTKTWDPWDHCALWTWGRLLTLGLKCGPGMFSRRSRENVRQPRVSRA